MLEKKRFRDFHLSVKIVQDYVVVSSPDFGFSLIGGSLTGSSANTTPRSIGLAVLQAYVKIEDKLKEGFSADLKTGKTVTVGVAGSILGLSISSVRRLLASGKLQAVRTSGGHRRIYINSIDACLRNT